MDNQKIKKGISLIDEFMIDITGALMPGLLFLTMTSISIIVPIVAYCPSSHSEIVQYCVEKLPGGFFWALLIFILVLSYVVGHIFYRADITAPDKQDIEEQIKKETKTMRNLYKENPKEYHERILNQLYQSLIVLRKAYNKVIMPHINGNPVYDIYLCFDICLDKAISYIKEYNQEKIHLPFLLGVLFPEEVYRKKIESNPENYIFSNENVDGITLEELSPFLKQIWEEYIRAISWDDSIRPKTIPPLSQEETVCLLILKNQTEIGCIYKDEYVFPYVYYYKYLLKRNIPELVDLVTWNSREGRSKNMINKYKIRLQMFVTENYAIINRNESHIRLSSSTWYMAKATLYVSATMITLTLFRYLYGNIEDIHDLLSITGPIVVLIFSLYIRKKIIKYIHYQRMREIYYTLCAYKENEKIISNRKRKEESM